jgi:hypothetical protein
LGSYEQGAVEKQLVCVGMLDNIEKNQITFHFSYLTCNPLFIAGANQYNMSIENEKETNSLQILDEEMDIEEQQEKMTFDIAKLGQALKVASEGAITAKTVQTY